MNVYQREAFTPSNVIPFLPPNANQANLSVDSPAERGPIEAKMRSVLDKLKDTKYPDTFDWSVYDKISEKFDSPPRGGVVFNTTFKLVSHHASCSKCHYAFELDTYGRGCYHNCAYCYAKEQLSSHGYWNKPQPFPVNLAEIRKVFYTVFETDKHSRWRSVLEKRIPLRLGSMSDSFMWMDARYKITQELLKILAFYKYPYIVFTRSDLVAHDDYLELLNPSLCMVQFSISGNNWTLLRHLEPGAPSYKRRLKALEKLSMHGIWTGVRINPLFPTHPDGYYSNREHLLARYGSEDKIPHLPLFDDSFIQEIAQTGTRSVLAGFVRLSTYALHAVSRELGFDYKEFFNTEIQSPYSDRKYSDAEIGAYYDRLRRLCADNNLRFSTCYIGNGEKDYYQYQDLWSNKDDCCDAVGNVGSMKLTCQSLNASEIKQHGKPVVLRN